MTSIEIFEDSSEKESISNVLVPNSAMDDIRIIDIFSGVGGLSYGFHSQGYNILTAVDFDPHALKTYSRHFHTKYETICEDLTKKSILSLANQQKIPVKSIDLLIGGPPCQGFSFANRHGENSKIEKRNLIHSFKSNLKNLKPTFFLMENVAGIKLGSNQIYLKKFLEEIKNLGYEFREFEINCLHFGIPQIRNRYLLLGSLKSEGRDLEKIVLPKGDRKITLKKAISDLPKVQNGNKTDILPYQIQNYSELSNYQKMMRKYNIQTHVSNNTATRNQPYVIERFTQIKPGGNWRSIRHMLHNYRNVDNCHSSIYRRLQWNQPSITITNFRKNMIIHPSENRLLTVREAARIQSFPDHFVFLGPKSVQEQHVANAVPPLVSEFFAKEIKKHWY
ncbi:MAG: DNA cytosine methyltransferase [Candidatus Lokiarchaeota archaeon]|nr:DNA cytosine methyltransferase [Candidatus Harpocratesius repetitus]